MSKKSFIYIIFAFFLFIVLIYGLSGEWEKDYYSFVRGIEKYKEKEEAKKCWAEETKKITEVLKSRDYAELGTLMACIGTRVWVVDKVRTYYYHKCGTFKAQDFIDVYGEAMFRQCTLR